MGEIVHHFHTDRLWLFEIITTDCNCQMLQGKVHDPWWEEPKEQTFASDLELY